MIVNNELDLDTTSRYQYYNYIFGDPCPGTAKILRIQYRYGTDPEMSIETDAVVDENFSIHIERTNNVEETEETEVTAQEDFESPLIILRAWYGDPNDGARGIDVMAVVESLIENNELHLAADSRWFYYNSYFGDPCPNTVKSLQVRYKYGNDGLAVSVTVGEDEPLHITDNRLVIVSGWYGDPNNANRGVDVTDILNSMIVGNELHLDTSVTSQYYNSIFGDPCPGTAKTLKIHYRYGNGQVLRILTGAVTNENVNVDIVDSITTTFAVRHV
jgi:hypothetical protein